MGGCKCTFRKCQNTSISGFHFFHYPTRDLKRCEQWIINARKAQFHSLPKEKLRNKVVCQFHFEDNYFMNYKHDRLTPFAIPTIDLDGDDNNDVSEIQVVPICRNENSTNRFMATDFTLVAPELNKINLPDINVDLNLSSDLNQTVRKCANEEDIRLIPTSVDKTTFLLSEITEMNTFSCTYDQPLSFSNICSTGSPLGFNNELHEMISQQAGKKLTVKVISNKSRTSVIQPKIKITGNKKTDLNINLNNAISSNDLNENINNLKENTMVQQNKTETVYSVSSTNGDLELVPVEKSSRSASNDFPTLLTKGVHENQNTTNNHKPNEVVYSISLDNDNQEFILNPAFNTSQNQMFDSKNDIILNQEHNTVNNHDSMKTESLDLIEYDNTMSSSKQISIQHSVYNNEYELAMQPNTQQNEYIKQIKKNSKQIENLKQLFYAYKRKQARRGCNKFELSKKRIFKALSKHVNPTLSTIVQMELFNYKDQWTTKEKTMAIEMYSASPEGYSILKNKWGWKMPPTDLVQKWMKED